MIAPDCQSVFDAFARAAERWPERPLFEVLPETAACYGIQPGAIDYETALGAVRLLRGRLAAAGYGPGHRVMLLRENRPDFFLWWLALNALGASAVPVNPDLRAAELAYMIGHAEPALAIANGDRCAALEAAAQEAGIAMHAVPPETPLPHPRADAAIAKGTGTAREAALLYTSGTTGAPKGCILANSYFLEAGRWYAQAGGLCALDPEAEERMLTPLPVFHMNAMAYSFMAMIAVGGCLIALDRFHPRTWWDAVRTSRATCLHYLGVMPSMLMGAAPAPDDRSHSVRFGFGAGVDPKLHGLFEERFGFPLVEAWAMTETGAGAVICANDLPRRVGESCLGRAGAGLEVRLIGEDGAEAERGELLVRRSGPDPRAGFFSGYFKDPAATDAAWDGGWFHTGDIVRRAEDGALFFVDRKKNVIRRSGENIAAIEVESVLARHPAIAGVAVTAVPDPVRGDEVFALIQPKAGTGDADLAAEITRWCLTRLAYYKAPGYIAFVADLPLTATQKLQRGVVKSRAAALAAASDPATGTHDLRALKKRSAA